MRMHAAAAGEGHGVPQGGKDHGIQGAVLHGGRTVQTYTLEVIEAQPEEGGGGAVRATLLSNCATVLLKVRACLGQWHVVVLMRVRDRWTGAQRHWQTRMCHWSWWGRRTRRCGCVRVQVALEDYQAVVNGFRALLEHEHVAGSQAEEQA